MQEAIYDLKKMERNQLDLEIPSKNTVKKMIKFLQIPLHTLWKGASVDACHETKANELRNDDFFDKLANLLQKYKTSEKKHLQL